MIYYVPSSWVTLAYVGFSRLGYVVLIGGKIDISRVYTLTCLLSLLLKGLIVLLDWEDIIKACFLYFVSNKYNEDLGEQEKGKAKVLLFSWDLKGC